MPSFVQKSVNKQTKRLEEEICCVRELVDNIIIGDLPIVIGESVIEGGDNNSILYDNNGLVGELELCPAVDDCLGIDRTNGSEVLFLDEKGNFIAPAALASSLIIGGSTVTGATNGYLLYNNSGILGNTNTPTLNYISLSDGLVSALAIRLGADGNNGIYGLSDTQIGVAVEGVLVAGFDAGGLFTDNIIENTASAGVTVDGVILKDGGIQTTTQGIGVGAAPTSMFNGIGTNIAWSFDDTTQVFKLEGQLNKAVLSLDAINGLYQIGDIAAIGNALYISIDDANKVIDIVSNASGGGVIKQNGQATYSGTVAGAAALNVVNGLIMA